MSFGSRLSEAGKTLPNTSAERFQKNKTFGYALFNKFMETPSKKEQLEEKRAAKEAARVSGARRRALERLAIWGVVLLILGGIFAIIWNSGNGTVTKIFNDKIGAVVPDDHVFGNSLSTINLIEYSDFQCPACRAAEPFVKDIQTQYGNRIKIVYRHFPLTQHLNARPAAYASEAASNQGKFWEMHDKLFDNQDSWVNQANPGDTFISYAKELGLDTAKFRADYVSDAVKARVERDLQQGIAAKINATPTFYLNDYQLDLPNFSALRTAIEEELNKK